uniref:Uncharacterized protein n=1 Tax=Sphaerodactylus townsendi TaxID=933632 RepID=A0ACB8EAZ9_9SAUR
MDAWLLLCQNQHNVQPVVFAEGNFCQNSRLVTGSADELFAPGLKMGSLPACMAILLSSLSGTEIRGGNVQHAVSSWGIGPREGKYLRRCNACAGELSRMQDQSCNLRYASCILVFLRG